MFFLWNPQLKTDSANTLLSFQLKDPKQEFIHKNCYVIFLGNISSKKVCVAVEKNQYVENQIKATEQQG